MKPDYNYFKQHIKMTRAQNIMFYGALILAGIGAAVLPIYFGSLV